MKAEVKLRTRDRILDTARRMFAQKGFQETTTRDIAATAGVASGTIFNYFPTKEALAMSLIAGALDAAAEDFEARRRGHESLEEALFLFIITGLKRLEPLRNIVPPAIETGLSPFTRVAGGEDAERLRVRHLETVAELMASYTPVATPSFVAVHLYWTLYLGVLAFWSRDSSPHQEDTLVVLDQSLRLFAASLALEPDKRGSAAQWAGRQGRGNPADFTPRTGRRGSKVP